jgi:NADH-quinone oxidoreductase subunit N
MTRLARLSDPVLLVALALAAALLLLLAERRRSAVHAAATFLLVLVPCAIVLAHPGWAGGILAPLVAALIVAALAREGADPLPGECALKLLWVLGGAFALTGVGLALITLATGASAAPEQWGVLDLGLTQPLAWSIALPLVLLAGVVLLGGAPFHFWVADLFQGAPAALAPLAVATLQALGAAWLTRRLAGIEAFGAGAALAGTVLRTAAVAAFLAGAGTILWQRRPERRVGTLASLQGGLALASLAVALERGRVPGMAAAWLAPWAAHLVLALSGAALLARLTPVDLAPGAPGGPLFRRHPLSALAGLYALFSLAGVPGTPGARLWLGVAQGLAAEGRNGLLFALALGWLAAFATVARTLREGFGASTAVRPTRGVPWPVRAALWLSGLGLAVAGLAGFAQR